jgi:hypothetical protein
MNRWLLLYTMVVLAADLIVFAVSFMVTPRWKPRLLRMMLTLSMLGFAVGGATDVAAGMLVGGWSQIAAATFGAVFLPFRENFDGRIDRRRVA